MAITYIKGPEVDSWAKEIGHWVDYDLHPINDDVEQTYIMFLENFTWQFEDSPKETWAQTKIKDL